MFKRELITTTAKAFLFRFPSRCLVGPTQQSSSNSRHQNGNGKKKGMFLFSMDARAWPLP